MGELRNAILNIYPKSNTNFNKNLKINIVVFFYLLFLSAVTTINPYPDCNELMIDSTTCVLLADVILLVDSSSIIAPSDYKLMKDALAAGIYNLVTLLIAIVLQG